MAGLFRIGRVPNADPRLRRVIDNLSSLFSTSLLGVGLDMDGGKIVLSHLGFEDLTDPNADRIAFWDDSAGTFKWMSVIGNGLTLDDTSLYFDWYSLQDLDATGHDLDVVRYNAVSGTMGWGSISTGLQWDGTDLKTKDSEIVHDDLSGFVGNEHIDWTNASEDFFTTGSVGVGEGAGSDYPLEIVASSAHTTMVSVDGYANIFTGTSGNAYGMFFRRRLNCGDGNDCPDYYYQYLNHCYPRHTNAIITQTKAVMGFYNVLDDGVATYENQSGSNRLVVNRGILNSVDAGGTYNSIGAGRIEGKAEGIYTSVVNDGIYSASGGATNRATAYGCSLYVTNTPTLDSGALLALSYGLYLNLTGSTTGSSIAYGIFMYNVQNADNNYGIYMYNPPSHSIVIDGDNCKIQLGETNGDLELYSDGTDGCIDTGADLNISTNGVCDINGLQVDANGFLKPVSAADASAPNNSIYYSTTQSKLVYKDNGGIVNDLY